MTLFVLVLFLNFIGMVMVLSASSVVALDASGSSWAVFQRQGMWLGLGLLALFIGMRIDYRTWQRFVVHGLVASIGLLVLVLVPGVGNTANGATRWIVVGPFSLQPSELAKLALAIFAADLLSRRAGHLDDLHAGLKPVMLVTGVFAVLVMAQPNLGTTIMLGIIAITLLFASGVPLAPLAGVTGGGVLVAAFFSMQGYRKQRVLAVLDPWEDPLNTGYQTIQSLVGIADGGVTGVGLGAGRAKWGYLPFAHTDFIYSVIAEELGLVGSLGIIAAFLIIAVVGLGIARNAPEGFGMLLAIGITVWVVAQAFINIGAVIGLIPITGLPLPFVSAGGSSLVVTMAASGILLNIARQGRT